MKNESVAMDTMSNTPDLNFPEVKTVGGNSQGPRQPRLPEPAPRV